MLSPSTIVPILQFPHCSLLFIDILHIHSTVSADKPKNLKKAAENTTKKIRRGRENQNEWQLQSLQWDWTIAWSRRERPNCVKKTSRFYRQLVTTLRCLVASRLHHEPTSGSKHAKAAKLCISQNVRIGTVEEADLLVSNSEVDMEITSTIPRVRRTRLKRTAWI